MPKPDRRQAAWARRVSVPPSVALGVRAVPVPAPAPVPVPVPVPVTGTKYECTLQQTMYSLGRQAEN